MFKSLFIITLLLFTLSCVTVTKRNTVTFEKGTPCNLFYSKAVTNDRPMAVALPDNKFVAFKGFRMLGVNEKSNCSEITVIDEVITPCGTVIQLEDFDGDGKPEREVIWQPALLEEKNDSMRVYFYPSVLNPTGMCPEDYKRKSAPAPNKKPNFNNRKGAA